MFSAIQTSLRRLFARANAWFYPRRVDQVAGAAAPAQLPELKHLSVLDGWRGISIALVLAAHLIPLGRIANNSLGLMGMVLFFNLSGFLITSFLMKEGATVPDFLIRRLFRILPLAWLYLVIVLVVQDESVGSWFANMLFYGNVPSKHIHLATDHLWSLDVEMQFYLGVALLFGLFGRRGLSLLPLFALLVTALRVIYQQYDSSVTWFRIDEILAGCTLALIYRGRFGKTGAIMREWMRTTSPWYFVALLVLASLWGLEEGRWVNYFRPYVGMLLIGSTLLGNRSGTLHKLLNNRPLQYLAAISFATYVVHVGLFYTWLGSGDFVERYSKRPLLFVVLFFLAHISTFYYEHPCILFGKRLSAHLKPRLASTKFST